MYKSQICVSWALSSRHFPVSLPESKASFTFTKNNSFWKSLFLSIAPSSLPPSSGVKPYVYLLILCRTSHFCIHNVFLIHPFIHSFPHSFVHFTSISELLRCSGNCVSCWRWSCEKEISIECDKCHHTGKQSTVGQDRRDLPNQFREVGKSFLEKVMSEVWRLCGN